MVLLVPSDADGGGDDGGVPTTLPAWQVPRGYHAQGSNIPFGESLTLIYIYIYIYIYTGRLIAVWQKHMIAHSSKHMGLNGCTCAHTHTHTCKHPSEGFPERDI